MYFQCHGCESNFDTTEINMYELTISIKNFGEQMISKDKEWLCKQKQYCEYCYNGGMVLQEFKRLTENW